MAARTSREKRSERILSEVSALFSPPPRLYREKKKKRWGCVCMCVGTNKPSENPGEGTAGGKAGWKPGKHNSREKSRDFLPRGAVAPRYTTCCRPSGAGSGSLVDFGSRLDLESWRCGRTPLLRSCPLRPASGTCPPMRPHAWNVSWRLHGTGLVSRDPGAWKPLYPQSRVPSVPVLTLPSPPSAVCPPGPFLASWPRPSSAPQIRSQTQTGPATGCCEVAIETRLSSIWHLVTLHSPP